MATAAHVSGAQRLTRGCLASSAAVGSAVAAHAAAGHHAPHLLVVVLALVISLPLCTALAALRFSRLRLAGSVLSSQAVLHGLFSFLPASAAAPIPGAAAPDTHAGHAAGQTAGQTAAPLSTAVPGGPAETVAGAPESAVLGISVFGGVFDLGMTLSHLAAAALTVVVLRRGELLLQAVADLLSLRPARLLLAPREALFGARAARPVAARFVPVVDDLWVGHGPRTVRGPPVFA
ncbi:hypothetical protein [Nesterenkonia suensis]